MQQLGFAEALMATGLGRNARLERLHDLIDWPVLAGELSGLRDGKTGRPPYTALVMLKALYLQTLYDLSDAELEEALNDRLSFRRFCGMALEETAPDATTICRFRQAASDRGVLERCFRAITDGLERQGFVTRKGTLMDATLVAAKHNPPGIEAGRGAGHAAEPEANWTYKAGRAHFGYKLHVGMDQGGIVRRAVFSTAKLYESQAFDALLCGDEAAVYGDKAYEHKARRRSLRARGIKDRLMHRADKWHPVLDAHRQRRNALIAKRRAPVEAVFSALKRHFGLRRARYASLVRNAARAFAALTLLNLCRAIRTTTA